VCAKRNETGLGIEKSVAAGGGLDRIDWLYVYVYMYRARVAALRARILCGYRSWKIGRLRTLR